MGKKPMFFFVSFVFSSSPFFNLWQSANLLGMAEFTWMLPMQSCNKRNRRKKDKKEKNSQSKANETKTEKAFILISFAILQIYDILMTS